VGQAGGGLPLGVVEPHAGHDVVEHGHGNSCGATKGDDFSVSRCMAGPRMGSLRSTGRQMDGHDEGFDT
jgi:hypothetical protein